MTSLHTSRKCSATSDVLATETLNGFFYQDEEKSLLQELKWFFYQVEKISRSIIYVDKVNIGLSISYLNRIKKN